MFGVEPYQGQGYEAGLHRKPGNIISQHNSQMISSSVGPKWLKPEPKGVSVPANARQLFAAVGMSSHGTGLTLEPSQPKHCQCLSKDKPLTALIFENGDNTKNTQVTNHVQYHQETHLPLGNTLHELKGLQNTEPTEQNYLLV